MKKMIMILMALIVSMTTTLFADSYVAFTSEEEFEEYRDSNHSEWDAELKALFEECAAEYSAKQKKRFSLIVVRGGNNDEDIKNIILVYHHINDSKIYGVIIFDENANVIVFQNVYAYEDSNPVQVGLSCLKEEVTHVVNVNKGKVIFALE